MLPQVDSRVKGLSPIAGKRGPSRPKKIVSEQPTKRRLVNAEEKARIAGAQESMGDGEERY